MEHDDSNGDDNDDLKLPEGAPKDLQVMAENIRDIFSPIRRFRGDEYANKLMLLMCIHSQVIEIESIACETSQAVRLMADEYVTNPESKETLIKAAIFRHDMSHFYAEAIIRHIAMLTEFIETLPEYDGFSRDLKTLTDRIQTDWKKKGH